MEVYNIEQFRKNIEEHSKFLFTKPTIKTFLEKFNNLADKSSKDGKHYFAIEYDNDNTCEDELSVFHNIVEKKGYIVTSEHHTVNSLLKNKVIYLYCIKN